MDVERCTIDGVETLWAPDREGEPLRAALMFRVGLVDETLPTAGITHLVEHLALFPFGETVFGYGGSVELLRTRFVAEGQPEEIASFLADVCRNLDDLPLDRLEDERRVLLTELDGYDPGVGPRLLAMRFGLTRWGLPVCRQVGIDHLDGDAIAAWARRWFTAGNAVLWLSGPPPDGLTLGLEPGVRQPVPAAAPLPELELPAYVSEGTGGIAVSGVVGEHLPAVAMGHLAIDRLMERLRRDRGITYDADWWSDSLGEGRMHMVIGADCLDEHAPVALDAMLRTLEELAGGQLSDADLERHHEQARRGLATPEVGPELERIATGALIGSEPFTAQRVLRELDDLTIEAIAQAARELIDSAIVLAPSDVPMPTASRMRRYGEWSTPPVGDGRRFRARSRLRGRGDELVVGADGVTMRADGVEGTVRLARCVAAFRTVGGGISLVAEDDRSIDVDPADWRDGEQAVEAIVELLPRELVVDAPGLGHAERIEALAHDLPQRWSVKGELAVLPGLLGREERLVTLARWETTMKIGLLAMTDRRVLFLYDGSDMDVDELPYAELEGVEATGRGKVTFVRDGDRRTVSVQPKERIDLLVAEATRQVEAARQSAPTQYF